MMGGLLPLLAVFVLWMAACAWAGYTRRFVMFLGILLLGLMMNTLWLIIGFGSSLTDPNALIALSAATLYGLCGFGSGWLVGRLRRAWLESQVK